jgi:hypothetical protein
VRFQSLAAFLLAWSLTAEARVEQNCDYTKSQVFNSALRFIRVDNGYPVSEKDEASGYLLFGYRKNNSADTTPASFEIIEHESAVQVVVRIPELPEEYERLLVRRFFDKLRADYGEPRPRKPPEPDAPKAPKEDAPKDPDGGESPSQDGDTLPRSPKVSDG